MLAKNSPTFDEETRELKLPKVTGVTWEIDGREVQSSNRTLADGQSVEVKALLAPGFKAKGKTSWTFGK